jgi:pyruvate ferredoxin oxidoreductase gamma subunit
MERCDFLLAIRIQGRGGQGAQTAGEILAAAFFRDGNYVQAFSTYGGARRGTPVSTSIRVDQRPIRLRCDIENPDVVLCFDPSLLGPALLRGSTADTLVLINSGRPPSAFASLGKFKLATLDALSVAQVNQLGRIVNTALVGALAGLLARPRMDVLSRVIAERNPVRAGQNVKACRDGSRLVIREG